MASRGSPSAQLPEIRKSCADALFSENFADVILDSGTHETFEVWERRA
jgi:hypothetical protein